MDLNAYSPGGLTLQGSRHTALAAQDSTHVPHFNIGKLDSTEVKSHRSAMSSEETGRAAGQEPEQDPDVLRRANALELAEEGGKASSESITWKL